MWETFKTELKKRIVAVACVGIVAIPTALWFLVKAAGYAPVFANELQVIEIQVAANSNGLAWVQHGNTNNFLKNGGTLRPRACANYRRLSAHLKVRPQPCAPTRARPRDRMRGPPPTRLRR